MCNHNDSVENAVIWQGLKKDFTHTGSRGLYVLPKYAMTNIITMTSNFNLVVNSCILYKTYRPNICNFSHLCLLFLKNINHYSNHGYSVLLCFKCQATAKPWIRMYMYSCLAFFVWFISIIKHCCLKHSCHIGVIYCSYMACVDVITSAGTQLLLHNSLGDMKASVVYVKWGKALCSFISVTQSIATSE